ncbi:NACHT, LRR and PYD domains-containing protein 12-like, partial [Silurus meridionalis]
MLNQENRTLLNEIYTELYITEGDSGDVNKEHEVKQIEAASRRNPTEDTPITCSDIFKPLPEQDKQVRDVLTKLLSEQDEEPIRRNLKKTLSEQDEEPIRNVLTKGVAGIGKTVSVQKFVLDWAEREANQDVHLIFPLPFRELNLMKELKLSLVELLHVFFKEMKEMDISRLEKVLFIFDLMAVSDQNLANKIITHLNSLRSLYIMCHIPVFCWISAAVLERMLVEAESGEIPKTLTQMYTHFLIIQTNIIREKYLQKQESDEEMLLKLGKLAFQQLEKQNLIFYEEDLRECGIDVTEAAVYSGVCTQIFREESGFHQSKVYCFVHLSIQEHLAALYVHLNFMKEHRNVLKRNQVCKTLSDVYRSAVDQALKSQTGRLDLFLRFLLGFSLESNQKLLYSLVTQTGSSTQSKEETVQYIKKKISRKINTEKSINLFHCLNELGDDSLVEEIQQYLKSGAQSELSPSQWSALVFVLLTSAQDLEEFDLNKYITPDKIRDEILVRVMPVIAASRKAIIRCSEKEKLRVEALTSVLNSETSSLRELHLTVNTLDLSWNKLEDSGVKRLSALLENPECKVKDLRDVCVNKIQRVRSSRCKVHILMEFRKHSLEIRMVEISGDNKQSVGVSILQVANSAVEFTQCLLSISTGRNVHSDDVNCGEFPWLYDCGVSDEGCAALASALRSNPSHLRELNLSLNKVGDSGVKCLSAVLENPHCKLEILSVCHCVSAGWCIVEYQMKAALASALRSNPSHLRDLNLSDNKVGDSGVKCLSAVLEKSHCKLETLGLGDCGVSDEGCAALSSALRSNPSNLRDLDLSENILGDPGVKFLSAVLENLQCKLEILGLEDCGVSDEGCAALTSALRSNPSHLRELDLSRNKVGDLGVKCLSAVLENPHCKLDILRLWDCGVSDEGCAALASALRSIPSHLRELDLSKNKVGDTGVKCLSAVLENPHCKLEILRLCDCGVSDEGCAALASALRSNPSHLRDLHLTENKVGDSGVKCLSDLKDDERYKLQTLK